MGYYKKSDTTHKAPLPEPPIPLSNQFLPLSFICSGGSLYKMYQKEKTEREGFIQDVSKRKNRTSESEVRFRLKPSYTPSRQNPYHLNPLPRRLGKINHRFKTRYFFLWFLLYNIYVRVSPPPRPRVTSRHAPEGGVAMPSLSEGNLDLKIGYLDHGFPQKPEISGL